MRMIPIHDCPATATSSRRAFASSPIQSQATPFSLGTVQRAMRALTEDGIVMRRQGHGSFVADSRARMDDPWHCRFWTRDGTGFLPVYPKVLSRRRIAERGPWSRPLGQQGGDRNGDVEGKRG